MRQAAAAENLNLATRLPAAPQSPLTVPGDWDGYQVAYPRVVWDGSQYRMFYDGRGFNASPSGWMVGAALSQDGILWTKSPGNPLLGPGAPGEWDSSFRGQASILYEAGVIKMWYSGAADGPWQTGYAWSLNNGVTWSFAAANPVLTVGAPGSWEEQEADGPSVLHDGGLYKMWYHGCISDYSVCSIGYAESPDGANWTKHPGNPVLTSGAPGEWDEGWVVWPTVIKNGTTFEMWYSSNGKIGLATSADGINWTKFAGNPVLDQGWDGEIIRGISVVREGPLYRMWLSSGIGPSQGIGYAESLDGINWSMPVANPVLPRGDPGIYLEVNYAHDWAATYTAPGEVVTFTVNHAGEVFTLVSQAHPWDGWYGTYEGAWDPYQPNIVPGDSVIVANRVNSTTVDPVGSIDATLDLNADTVSGVLNAPFGSQTLDVYCEVWVENPPPSIYAGAVAADGGSFTCDFSSVGWDLQPRQDVALRYVEPDGDNVINIVSSPWARVNYRDNWAGVNYPAGHPFTITVTDDSGGFKASASGLTYSGGGWGSDGWETRWEDWIPRAPDILPGDWVVFQSDDGYNNSIRVGEITGDLDTSTDSLSGYVHADWFTGTLDIECHPWGAPGPVPAKYSSAAADGSSPYTCQWDPLTEWDILSGQDVAAMYIEADGDRVINAFRDPAPYLHVWTWSQGFPAEGGNHSVWVEYQNTGEAPAEDVVISSTLEGGWAYLGDTSGLPHTGSGAPGDPLVWQIGDLPVSMYSQRFEIFVEVTGNAYSPVSHQVQIGTSTVYGGQNPWDLQAIWDGEVQPNDTHLEIGKWAWTWEPLPGSDFIYTVNACNNGSTGSSELTITDNLPLSTTLVTWWSQFGGWQEVSTAPQQVVLSRPTLSSWYCADVYIKVHVDPAAAPGTPLQNTAEITATNDIEPGDNFTMYENYVAYSPRPNLSVWKGWPASGQYVPGGYVVYELSYGNSGNVPADNVELTFALPANTTFVRAWTWTPGGDVAVDPSQVTPDAVIWDLGTLPDGFSRGFQLLLRIDDDAVPGQGLSPTLSITRLPWEERYDDNKVGWTDQVNDYGPNLKVDKQTYNWLWEGRVWYNLRILNPGTELLENFRITDTLPAGTVLADWWQDHGPPITGAYNSATNQVVFDVEWLNPGETASLGILIDLEPQLINVRGLTFTNQVDAPIAGDVYPPDNSDQVTVSTGADVFARKWVSGGMPLPGEIITFTVEFGNRNVWPWDTNIQVGSHLTETLPAGMTFITATAPWTPGATWDPQSITIGPQGQTTIVWGWGTMWSNSNWTFDIVVRIDDDTHIHDVLVNRIEAYGDDPAEVEIDWTNNEFVLPVRLEAVSELFLPLVNR